jgi:hypothetical protein
VSQRGYGEPAWLRGRAGKWLGTGLFAMWSRRSGAAHVALVAPSGGGSAPGALQRLVTTSCGRRSAIWHGSAAAGSSSAGFDGRLRIRGRVVALSGGQQAIMKRSRKDHEITAEDIARGRRAEAGEVSRWGDSWHSAAAPRVARGLPSCAGPEGGEYGGEKRPNLRVVGGAGWLVEGGRLAPDWGRRGGCSAELREEEVTTALTGAAVGTLCPPVSHRRPSAGLPTAAISLAPQRKFRRDPW